MTIDGHLHADRLVTLLRGMDCPPLEEIRAMAGRCFDADSRDSIVRTAAHAGHYEALRVLSELGYSLSDDEGYSLILAAQNGHAETVRLLIREDVSPRTHADEALVVAAGCGALDVVDLLLLHGCDPAAQANAPLLCALMGGHARIVSRLLAAGATVDGIEDQAVQHACGSLGVTARDCLELIQPFVPLDVLERIALQNCAFTGDLLSLKWLLDRSCEPTAHDCEAFAAAFSARQAEAALLLMEYALSNGTLLREHLSSLVRRGFAADAMMMEIDAQCRGYRFPDDRPPSELSIVPDAYDRAETLVARAHKG